MRGKFLSRIRVNSVLLIMLPLLFITSLPAVSATDITPTSGTAYDTLGYVTYNIDLTLEVRGNPGDIRVYIPRWKNWSSEVAEDTHSVQESVVQNATPYGYDVAVYNQTDSFNNSIDYFRKIIPYGDKFYLTMNYTLTAKQVRWNNLGTHSMSEYDIGSSLYQLYTQDQLFINGSDPDIQGNASAICGTETNPVEKARKIYEWVSKNIAYEMQEGSGSGDNGERGAWWALTYRKGDCSEYSDLMVAMLRAQDVPARKVVGLAMLQGDGHPIPSYSNGSSWDYLIDYGSSFNNVTGHAWVEYYVPGAGWVSCDPTWGVNRTDNFYFNYHDYLHIVSTKGEWFGDEVYPPLTNEESEYPAVPCPSKLSTWNFYRLKIHVTVLDNHEWVDATALIWVVSILVVISVIAIIYWVGSGRRKKAIMNDNSY